MPTLNQPNPDAAYPDAVSVMDKEAAGSQDAAKVLGDKNPVLDALQTLGMFAKAQAEQGNAGILQAFKSFLDAVKGGGSEAQQEGEEEPQEQEEQGMGGMPPGMPGKKMKMGMNGGKGMTPENSKARVLTNT